MGARPTRAGETTAEPFKVEVKEDITYCEGLAADTAKHQLDLYVPSGAKGFPVLFFVHGGAWTIGDKKGDLGVYQVLGRSIARQGIGVVVPNYRLSPRVRHPAHIEDVARAFAWTVKHIEEYGGRKDAIFICGHSAGAHLISLLVTDPRFLKAGGLSVKAIRGVIPISGVYQVPDKGIFDSVFGKEPAIRKEASPLLHARENLPPFLILFADRDMPVCGKSGSEPFATALLAKGNKVDVLEIKGRNHISIVFNAITHKDPAREAISAFIRKNTPAPKKHDVRSND
jgi:acetyl esterase/lipase